MSKDADSEQSELVQPGAEVSKAEYERFKEFVRDAKGKVRGHLGTELENAMRQYREDYYTNGDTDALTRIENDISVLKAHIVEETDGGAGTLSEAENTHTQSDSDLAKTGEPSMQTDEPRVPDEDLEPVDEEDDVDDGSAEDDELDLEAVREDLDRDERPDPKGSRQIERAEYLAARVVERNRSAIVDHGVPEAAIRDVVDDEYAYGPRTAGPLTETTRSVLEDAGLVEYPGDDSRLVTPGRYEELLEEREAELEERAREREDAMYGSSDDVDEDAAEETSDADEPVDDPIEAALEEFRTKGGRDDVPRIVAETALGNHLDDVTEEDVDELLERYEDLEDDGSD